MERATLEKVIEILNRAVERNYSWSLENEISTILGETYTFELPEPKDENEVVDDEAIKTIISLLKHIKSQLKPEDIKFFLQNIHNELKPFIQDDETKVSMFSVLTDDYDEKRLMGYSVWNYNREIICSIDDDNIKIKLLDSIDDDWNKYYIIKSFHSEEKIIEVLPKLLDYDFRKMIIYQLSTKTILEHTREIMLLQGITEGIEEKSEKIKDMASRNSLLFKTFRCWELLDEKYNEMFTSEQMDLIALYPDIQSTLASIDKNSKKLELLSIILQNLEIKDSQAFQLQLEKLLQTLSVTRQSYGRRSLARGNYIELINNIDFLELTSEDIEKLAYLLQFPNIFNLKTMSDIRNYDNIKNRVCEAIIADDEEVMEQYHYLDYLDQRECMKLAVLEKLYGQDIESADALIEKYGKDIDSLPSEEPEVQYIKSLQIILGANKKLLRMLFDIDVSLEDGYINPILMEVNLKHLYGKEYNKGLCKVEDLELQEEGIYKVSSNFRMLITSVAAFAENYPDNFKEDWNRDSVVSQGFCCSYITKDMIGTAPVPHFCYGFNAMSEDSLMLSGPTDIYSQMNKFNPDSKRNELYYGPENQINNTDSRHCYNEIVYKRFQEGERKQPDYIVVFKRDGMICNIEKAKKAAEQWAKDGVPMPIVVVDEDECIENNKREIGQMLESCQSLDDLQKIKKRVANNMKWTMNNEFEELSKKVEELERKYSESQVYETRVEANIFEEAFNSTTSLQRINATNDISRIVREIQAKKQQFEQGKTKD